MLHASHAKTEGKQATEQRIAINWKARRLSEFTLLSFTFDLCKRFDGFLTHLLAPFPMSSMLMNFFSVSISLGASKALDDWISLVWSHDLLETVNFQSSLVLLDDLKSTYSLVCSEGEILESFHGSGKGSTHEGANLFVLSHYNRGIGNIGLGSERSSVSL